MVNEKNAARKVAPQEKAKHLSPALLISDRNSVDVTGQGFRWVKRTAPMIGVRVIKRGRKRFVPAAEFMAALEAHDDQPASVEPQDPTAVVFAALGWEPKR